MVLDTVGRAVKDETTRRRSDDIGHSCGQASHVARNVIWCELWDEIRVQGHHALPALHVL